MAEHLVDYSHERWDGGNPSKNGHPREGPSSFSVGEHECGAVPLARETSSDRTPQDLTTAEASERNRQDDNYGSRTLPGSETVPVTSGQICR
jgi:hypothetical protein